MNRQAVAQELVKVAKLLVSKVFPYGIQENDLFDAMNEAVYKLAKDMSVAYELEFHWHGKYFRGDWENPPEYPEPEVDKEEWSIKNAPRPMSLRDFVALVIEELPREINISLDKFLATRNLMGYLMKELSSYEWPDVDVHQNGKVVGQVTLRGPIVQGQRMVWNWKVDEKDIGKISDKILSDADWRQTDDREYEPEVD
jgi:hypothetical protein